MYSNGKEEVVDEVVSFWLFHSYSLSPSPARLSTRASGKLPNSLHATWPRPGKD
jgi:hypothetical protein